MTKQKNIGRAATWSAFDVLIRHGLSFVVLIILARMLAPSDFGMLAMLTLFVGIAGILIDSGFSQALIQRQQTTLVDESTIFFFTLLTGGVVALLLILVAPWIAGFYGVPLLEYVTYWMALNIFLNSLGAIHTTLLTKELDFKTIAKAGVVAALISGGIAIYMAMHGWGVWSLVGQILASTIVTVIMLWLLHPWRPRWIFSMYSLRTYFHFGGYLLWTGLLNSLHTNLYALLIGKLYSVQDVGFYSQAQRLQQFPVNIMTNMVGRVAFPMFSAATEDKARLARGLRKGLIITMFLNMPLMLGLAMLAEPLVLTLLGSKWLQSVPIMQALAFVGLLWPFHVLNLNVLTAQGHSALNARIQFIKIVIALSFLLIASPYGVLAIAYGQVLASMLAFFINAYYSKIFLDYGAVAQLRDVLPNFAVTLSMLCVIWLVCYVSNMDPQHVLLVASLSGLAAYLLVSKLWHLEALEELLYMLNRTKKFD